MNGLGTRPIRLLLVDGQPAVRRELRMRLALEPDLKAVDETGSATGAISLAGILRPDVVLMDVEMQDTDGIATPETLHAVAPGSAVVILTLRDDAATRARALVAGAAAFVAKHQVEETLLTAIRRVAIAQGKQRRHGRMIGRLEGSGA